MNPGKYLLLAGLFSCLCLLASAGSAQEDIIKHVEAKRGELKDKEEALKREEQRLNTLRKEVDEKIAVYTKLLASVEASLKKLDQGKGDRIDHIVKAYEIMPAEDAARRLAVLDTATALQIMTRMKSKKAGPIMAAMEPAKAAALTKKMAEIAKKDKTQ